MRIAVCDTSTGNVDILLLDKKAEEAFDEYEDTSDFFTDLGYDIDCISWMVIVGCVSLMKTRPCRHYIGNSWRNRYPRWRNSCCIPITHPGRCQTKNDPARIDDKTITKVPGEHVGHLFGRGSGRITDMAILQKPYHRLIRERRKIYGTALDTGADRS